MVVTRKKLRSFKVSSVAQRWQQKAESLEKATSSRKILSKAKLPIILRREVKTVTKHIHKEFTPIKKSLSKDTPKTEKQNTEETKSKESITPNTKENKVAAKRKREDTTPVQQAMHQKKRKLQGSTVEQQYFTCQECGFTTTNQSNFSKHIKRQPLSCTRCDFVTDLRCILYAHIPTCEEKRSKTQCNFSENLKLIAEKGPTYFCDFCPHICKERFEIVKHVKEEHQSTSTTESFWCSCCDFETKTKSNLRLHYVHVHNMLLENIKYIADRAGRSSVISPPSPKKEKMTPVLKKAIEEKELFEKNNPQKMALFKKEIETKGTPVLKKTMQQKKEDYTPVKKKIKTKETTVFKKNMQQKKEEYIKGILNKADPVTKETINRSGKENKKQQYIEHQLSGLHPKKQHDSEKKVTRADETPSSSEGSESSFSGQSDESEIAEIIKVFFQDKAIEISLKKSSQRRPSTGKPYMEVKI